MRRGSENNRKRLVAGRVEGRRGGNQYLNLKWQENNKKYKERGGAAVEWGEWSRVWLLRITHRHLPLRVPLHTQHTRHPLTLMLCTG
ncbi:unnamed protein product, partial [Nesidiocoris tenuis]